MVKLVQQDDFISDKALTFDGIKTIDPSKINYYGNSQGGIMGTSYMAVTQDITRGVVGVNGGPMVQILPRSKDFTPFYDILKTRFAGRDRLSILHLVGMQFTRTWPGGYQHYISKKPLPQTPPKTLISFYALGDA